MPPAVGYNLFPDEKGTERPPAQTASHRPARVTTYSPMKRGLKAPCLRLPLDAKPSYNLFPDEKGTESWRELQYPPEQCLLQPIPR